ncbi:molybdate ABC transporter substrate-binding protein [Profundibacterium mesophilum]|uniref:ABC molybdate transporter periplasmic binding protein ModA n=1 Tax=Profundibacterium mesophilum KAUST100406-0324 TaxID=1037889 RepID=A0A921TDV0_9RHOB|nr:molybdate ABC transporter substrate-binding protein [Profundibacterium mesophilum]KAF0677203.1 ABC molybdate transporter periplasmic binding protein ModA [Profundibacterium mesophilum KAUST100406-0324]
MRPYRAALSWVAAAFCTAAMPAPGAAADLLVFAAASLGTALERIEADWEARTGSDIAISYAGSSQLARQIELGAPADLFISANGDWMDHLVAGGLIDGQSRRDILGNTLVLIAQGRGAAPHDALAAGAMTARLGEGRLAMALVDAVPAGIYGRAALVSLGLWEEVSDRVAQADNVRAALALVASGAAPLGIVYASDATAQDDVSVIATFPEGSHAPIRYPAALTAGARPEARAFLDHLGSPEAQDIFAQAGFIPAGT